MAALRRLRSKYTSSGGSFVSEGHCVVTQHLHLVTLSRAEETQMIWIYINGMCFTKKKKSNQ